MNAAPLPFVTDWSRERVLVTGSRGFLGREVVSALQVRGVTELEGPARAELDLMERTAVRSFLARTRPTVVFHLAAEVGGIGANVANPGAFLYRNMVMGAELLEACRLEGVRRIVVAGTSCSYPANAPLPLRPESFWDGAPAPETAAYGLAKKLLFTQGEAYRKQYGLATSHVALANLYGPGDHLDEQESHVLTALVRRFVEAAAAGSSEVVCWGTGTPTREFLFVRDAAEGLLLAAEKDPGGAPLNLGSGEEVAIAALARAIADAAGFRGAIRFDPTRPDGVARRCLDSSMARGLGFRPRMALAEGVRETVAWMRRELAR